MFLAAAAAAALVSVSGHAATSNKPIQVTAKVVQNCTITVGNMDFGSYDPVGANALGGTDLTATSDITVVCTKGSTGVSVGLDLGAHSTGTARQLANGAEVLSYSIADDAG